MYQYNVNDEYHIKICQKYIRYKLEHLSNSDTKSQDINLKFHVINNSTLLDNSIENIPDMYFYTLEENDQLYGFDLRELCEWVIINNRDTNPFTNNKLLPKQIKQIHRLYNKYNKNTLANADYNTPIEGNYSGKLTSFFIRLESYGCYANLEGYKSLTNDELQEFMNILYNNNEIIHKIIDEQQIIIPNNQDSDYKFKILDIFNYILNQNPIDQTTIALLFVDRLSYYLFNIKNDNTQNITSLENLDNVIDQIIQFNTFSIASNSEIGCSTSTLHDNISSDIDDEDIDLTESTSDDVE
jgi:hypothetical protein